MVLNTKQDIDLIQKQLNGKPNIATKVIKFLNSRSWNELKALGIVDRTSIIIDVQKVITKRNLVQQT